MFGDGLNAHCSDVSTPPVLDPFVINIEFDKLLVGVSVADIDFLEDILLAVLGGLELFLLEFGWGVLFFQVIAGGRGQFVYFGLQIFNRFLHQGFVLALGLFKGVAPVVVVVAHKSVVGGLSLVG